MIPMNPMQFLSMFPLPQQPTREPQVNHPSRVDVAIRILNDLAAKIMPRVAVNDMQIEEITPPELTLHEKALQQVCCQTLQDYLKGNLIPDVWEQKGLMQGEHGSGGILMACFRCYGDGGRFPKAGCVVCKGTGNVLILPSVLGRDQPNSPSGDEGEPT